MSSQTPLPSGRPILRTRSMSRKKTILDIAGQVGRGFQCLLEHSHSCIEICRNLHGAHPDRNQRPARRKRPGTQLDHRIAERFLVFGDRPLRSRYRRSLSPEQIRPQPSVNGLLVRLQRVFAQTEASMEKRSISLIGRIEILKHAQ